MSWTAAQKIQNRGGMKPCFDRLPGLQVSLIAGCYMKPRTTVEFRLTGSAWQCAKRRCGRACVVVVDGGEAPAPGRHAFSCSGSQTAGSR